MRHNPERVAWTVLLGAFLACATLTATTFLGGRWWLLNAPVDQTIRMQTSSGAVLVTPPDRAEAVANPDSVPIGSIIRAEEGAQATLNFIAPDGQTVLANILVYGGTQVTITQADSPRYVTGINPHRIRLDVNVGRVRAIVGVNADREVKMELRSEPRTWTILQTPGSNASVEAGLTRTIITVREGQALVTSLGEGQAIQIAKDERAEVEPNGSIRGPLPAERNLIENGDFSEAIATNWATNLLPPKNPNESPGQVLPVTRDGRSAIQFFRVGNDWGQAEVTQDINRDVRDFQSLRLQLDVLIGFQDIYNCGVFGTECPVMVKIKYLDVNGDEQEWLQGFYSFANANVPNYCVTCPAPRNPQHQQVADNQWQTFESENLLDIFNAAGLPAVTIKSITIYASGHTFESLVADVQLLGAE